MRSLVILVTGATAGIGRETALRLARAGHRVFATGRRVHALDTLVAEAQGTQLEAMALDVTSPDSVAAAKAWIDRRTNGYGVDVVVNNAGYGLVGPLESVTGDELRAQFETNVFGLMSVTRAFLPAMRARGSGRIVNVGSMGGRVTFPLMGAYHATKYALEAISDALRNELRPFGVRVSLIEPGAIRTEFNDRAMEEVSRYRTPDSPYAAALARVDEMRKQFEMSAVGPGPVADAIVHAALSRRPRARYVTPRRTHVLLALFRWMPTPIMDAVLRGMSGLTRARLLPAGARA
jgi:NAD(P)-dependent dehydrogenase (short-subunit alcohol dehydrogenase family)